MFYLQSERIKLIPFTNAMLQQCLADRATMEKQLGLNTSAMEMDKLFYDEMLDALINFWIPKTEANPENFMWFTNWEIIHIEKNITIGGIGFQGLPDDNGETETGYMIDKKFHRQGYASEALKCILKWGFTDERLKVVKAHTYPVGLDSQGLLKKPGFEIISEGEMILWKLRKEKFFDLITGEKISVNRIC